MLYSSNTAKIQFYIEFNTKLILTKRSEIFPAVLLDIYIETSFSGKKIPLFFLYFNFFRETTKYLKYHE